MGAAEGPVQRGFRGQHEDVGRDVRGPAFARTEPEIRMKKLLLAGIVLALSAPAASAFADDDRYGWRSHRSDHREHRQYHRDWNHDHREAHRDGFDSRREHRRYHREYRRDHHEFHDDHPDTRHDHYRSYRGGYSYAPSYRGYGYYYDYARPYRDW